MRHRGRRAPGVAWVRAAVPPPILDVELPTAEAEPRSREERIRAQRRAIPDSPGVYRCGAKRRGARCGGEARATKMGGRRHSPHPSRGGAGGLQDETPTMEYTGTETEGGARGGEQNFTREDKSEEQPSEPQ